MNKSYLSFLKKVKLFYKNINWLNKKKVLEIRSVWCDVKEYKNYSLTKHFFNKHDLLLMMQLKTTEKSFRKNSINYWVMRGWSEEHGISKVSELQTAMVKKGLKRIGCSVSSRKYLKLKGKTDDEIDKIMQTRNRHSFSDLTVNEHLLISTKGSNARVKQINTLKRTNPQLLKSQFSTTEEFYLSRGYSRDESKLMLKKRQTTFSRDKCITKYGEKDGLNIFNERQLKWQETLNSKDEDEKRLINSKKAITLENLQRKYGIELGKQKYFDILKKRKLVGSKEANNFFNKLIDILNLDEEPYWSNGIHGKEYFLYDGVLNKFYFYDFVLRNRKIIIEYNGESFHPRKDKLTEAEWKSWKVPFTNESADSKFEFDKRKNKFAESEGFDVIEIWSSDSFEFSLEKIVKYIS